MKQKIRKITRYIAIFLFVTIAVIGFVSYQTYISMVHRPSYKPERKAMILQERARLYEHDHARDISFTTKDGLKISGMVLLRSHAKRNIVICHGHKSAKEMPRPFIDMFPNDNILIFDFRAHGQSEGELTTFGYNEHLDVLGAVQFLQTNSETQGLPVYGIGVSMGAASLIHAAAHGAHFQALILDSTYARLSEQMVDTFYARTSLPRFPFMTIMVWFFERAAGFSLRDFNPCDDLALVLCPIMIIHSRDDTIVPFVQAEQLVRCASGQKSVWFVDHAYHGRISKEYGQEYARRAIEFFSSIAD